MARCTQLLLVLPYLIMDHRYISPLLSDENPEIYPILNPSLHADKISADFICRRNVELRLEHFASMNSIPGFTGHQTKHYLSDGSLPWYDNDIRDFDLMGFSYLLLSNIATAGLNLIHTMILARDQAEFKLLPSEFL
jgi:hypothetical protein